MTQHIKNIDILIQVLHTYKNNMDTCDSTDIFLNNEIEKLTDTFFNIFDKHNAIITDTFIKNQLNDYRATNENIKEILPILLLYFINK
tara:strand:+ start:220 stop:483 length:264 start_codon:yes stop_codon:yes gene_type:complete